MPTDLSSNNPATEQSTSSINKQPLQEDTSPKTPELLASNSAQETGGEPLPKRFRPDTTSLHSKIAELYGAPPSTWLRRYPPLSVSDTVGRPRALDQTKIKELTAEIESFAREHNIQLVERSAIKALRFGSQYYDEASQVGAHSEDELYMKVLAGCIDPELKNFSAAGVHGYGHSFQDSDILKVHGQSTSDNLETIRTENFSFHKINGNKSVILQDATRGCTAAVTAMLILDQGGAPDLNSLSVRNLGDTETMMGDLKAAGFRPLRTKNSDLSKLKKSIERHGSAIVTVDSGVGGHVVIVDAVDLDTDTVTIRDPAHGWMIDIRSSSLSFGSEVLHAVPSNNRVPASKLSGSLGGESSDASSWQPINLQEFGRAIQSRLATPDRNQDVQETRLIIQLQGDKTAAHAAQALFLKDPKKSWLILRKQGETHWPNTGLRWDSQSQSVVESPLSQAKGKLKLMMVGHGEDYQSDITLKAIREKTAGYHVVTFSGFSKLGYADTAAFESTLRIILDEEAQLAGGYDKLIIVAGATDEGIGKVYKLADELGIKKLGIVSQEGEGSISSYCKKEDVVLVNDPNKTWKVLTPDGKSSYMVLAAEGGAFYTLGGGEVAHSETIEAKHRGIETHVYAFDPDPQQLAQRKNEDSRLGKVVASYTPVNDAIKNNNWPEYAHNPVFGGRSIDELKIELQNALAHIPAQSVKQLDIDLVGCQLIDKNLSKSQLPDQLATLLLEKSRTLQIDPDNISLTTYFYPMRVIREDGKKEIYLPNHGWATKEEAITKNELYKSVWHYDSKTQKMVAEIPSARLAYLTDKLFDGKKIFHEFSTKDQKLIARFLGAKELSELSKRSKDGEVIHQAIRDLVKKYPNQSDFARLNGKETFKAMLDTKRDGWLAIADTLGIARYDQADTNASEIIAHTMRTMPSVGNTRVAIDSYTQKTLGQRAYIIGKLQAHVASLGKGVLGIGAAAALCRIYAINHQLLNKNLSKDEETKLRAEKALAISELSVDVTGEAAEWLANKWKIPLSKSTSSVANSRTGAQQLSNLKLGKHLTSGLRPFATLGATALSLVGTAFSWYGVYAAATEIKKLNHSKDSLTDLGKKAELTAQIERLHVNLGVNVATAIIGSGLTAGNAVSIISSIAVQLKIAGAASVLKGSAAIMSVAGPIGGAILVGAFIGLWIYNGVKTVEEFSKHIALDSFDKFLLGFGSMFGYVPYHLRISLEHQKFKEMVEKAARLEKSELVESLPHAKHFYFFPIETIPGKEIFDIRMGSSFSEEGYPKMEVIRHEIIPPHTYHPSVDINFDTSYYLSISSNDSGKKHTWLTPADFIHTRKTSEQISTDKSYSSGATLTLHGRTVNLPNSASLGTKNQNLDSGSVSKSLEVAIPQALRDILTTQSDAQLFAADETEHLALYCIHDNATKISFFKFSGHSSGYTVAAHLTQKMPEGLALGGISLPQRFVAREAWPFFHDLDNDGLADLVIVSKNGDLQVALQKRDGSFALTTEFSLYRQHDGDKLDIAWYDSILGFGDTSRILYSSTSGGTRYGHAVLSATEQKTRVSLVNLNRGQGVQEKDRHDKFVAPKDSKAGDFIFYLGGGRDKQASGGVNNDSFFILDSQTFCFLEGHAGTDTLNFSRLSQETVLGIQVDASNRVDERWGSQASITLKDGGSKVRVYFSDIENFTGTHGDDQITGDSKGNVIDGVGGNDTLSGEAGDDTLRGVAGTFKGGAGVDTYHLRRSLTNTPTVVNLEEDYSKGEDSEVIFEHYRITDIQTIAPEVGGHLLFTFKDGGQCRVRDFYANNTLSGPASAWYFRTADGFRFRLETAAQLPAVLAPLRDIAVSFQSALTEQDLKKAKIYLYAETEHTRARVEIFETIAGKENVKHEIQLPSMFDLNLHFPFGLTHFLTGFNNADNFIAATGAQMLGGQGADTYFIANGAQGVIEINNFDGVTAPAKDTLIVSWEISATVLSVKNGDLILKAAGQQAEVKLKRFMLDPKARHLEVRSLLGQTANLEVSTNGTAYLATGLLSLNQENRLELYSASQGNLELDGRSRDLSVDNTRSTVIIDRSGQGNRLLGTENVRNYLQVFSGENNRLYGGCLADELRSGVGTDYLEGKEGDDAYYVAGSATIFDTAGEDSLILLAEGKTQEELWLEKTTEGHLYILFRSDQSRQVIIKNYDQHKIEQIVINNHALTDIDPLIQAMAGMNRFASIGEMQANSLAREAMNQWHNLLTVSVA